MRKISNKGIILILVVVVIGLLIPKIKTLFSSSDKETKINPAEMMPAVESFILKAQDFENKIKVTGNVMASEEVEIRSEISGIVEKIYFDEGKYVNKGDLLLKIEDSELQAQLLKTEYQKKLAEEKEFRQRVLLEREAISQQEYDIALTELNTLKAEIQLIKARIAKTEIRSPFSGMIGFRYVSEGSYISPQVKITTLQNINTLKLEFALPEKYLGQIKIGNNIYFKTQSTNKIYSAKVYAIDPKIDPTTRTIQIRAIYENKNLDVFPGSLAEIEVVLEEIKNALLVPAEAIIPTFEGTELFVYKNGVAHRVKVQTGVRTGDMVQITQGLNPGDTIITTGILSLREGMRVKLVNSI